MFAFGGKADIAIQSLMSVNDPKRTSAAPIKALTWAATMPFLDLGAGMRRRDFIAGVAGAAAAWPRGTWGQQVERVRRIGVLVAYVASDKEGQSFVGAFKDGLRRLGWIEGRTVHVETRWGAADPTLMKKFAAELVHLQPDLILTQNTPATQSVMKETSKIPIVFANVADPVSSGFVSGLPRPGGNVTGFIGNEASLGGKWLELLKEIAPPLKRAVLLFNPITAPYAHNFFRSLAEAGKIMNVEAVSAPVHTESELEAAVEQQALVPNTGLIITPEAFSNVHRVKIVALAERYRLPAIYPYRFFAELGGLLFYGSDQSDNFRRAASYADRILRGDKPGELPVQVPVKFELVINLKTAKALGLNVPLQLLQRADAVIE